MNAIADEIAAVFAQAGAQGSLHAREVGVTDGPEVAVGADAPVVLASVFKIPVAVAYAREVAAGRLDETERTQVTARYRIGGIGMAGCADDVERRAPVSSVVGVVEVADHHEQRVLGRVVDAGGIPPDRRVRRPLAAAPR